MTTRSLRPALLALLALLSLGLLSAIRPPGEPQAPITVILVRHAETAGSSRTGGDPHLSEAGQARAELLGAMLESAGVTHLFASQFARTQEVLGPLAEATGLEVQVLNADALKQQIERLQALPAGSVAVVAGHSNTVPNMAIALGAKPQNLKRHPQYGPMFEHDQYGRMFQVTLPVDPASTAVKLLELHYGE